jgi:hypothetical protein
LIPFIKGIFLMKRPILIILALAAMVGIAGLYYYQRNSYSKEILKLEILAPEEADLLEEIEYIVKYKNNGNTRLEEPQLIFEFPSNSLPTEETSLRITKSLDDLGGAIYPGEEKTLHLKTRLLGKEGEAKTAKAILTYRPKNLKAYYESSTTFTTVITKVPLTFEFDLPTSIESGKDLRFQLNYFSNAEYPLSDLSVTVEYPSGFEFVDSTPSALEKTEWDVGLLNKAEGGRIEISGRLAGEIGEEKVFQAKIGSWREGEFVLIKEITKGISIAKPSLYISQQINGNPQYIASPGDLLHYQIFFKNIGEELLSNLFLIAGLEGKAFDFETLKSPEGDFEPGDNSIIFDWKRVHSLQFLDAGDEGMVEFWIKLKDEWEIKDSRDKNPTIKSKVYLSQVKEEFVNKVNSRLVISQKGYFEDEVFGNSGFIPPEVGKDTTYSITWRAENFYNDVQNVKVKATLPRNVELTGKIFPEESSSKFAFDSESREIVWEIGELKVSQGTAGTPAPNIAFQVKFTPSASQKGETPEIISQAQISGQDQWTGAILESASPAVDTSLLDDEAVDPEMGIVE